MAATASVIQVSGLKKEKMAMLRQQAKALGMNIEGYARHLIEEGISLERNARTKTFDELFAPVQARFRESGMSEEDLDRLVNAARSRRGQGTRRKKH